jgi:putative heme-binding domain-containing protein
MRCVVGKIAKIVMAVTAVMVVGLATVVPVGAVVPGGVAGGRADGQRPAQDHPGQYSALDIETGSRLYAGQCALCHGPNGDIVSGVNLRRGQFRRALSDEDLRRVITGGIPAAGMPALALRPSELDGLVAFIRAGFDVSGTAVKIGDARRGQPIFEGKGKCATCHRVNGNGPRMAPDLSDIGAIRTAVALQRSLLEPTKAMWPINRPVTAVTRDGRTIRGRRLNEDTFTVQLIDDQDHLVSLVKADLRSYALGAVSPMPPIGTTLTGDEMADLVAYLLSLQGL